MKEKRKGRPSKLINPQQIMSTMHGYQYDFITSHTESASAVIREAIDLLIEKREGEK